MRVGTDWVEEIAERIAWCDCFIVLLSADAVSSEMVVGEVRRAYRRWKLDGKPRILPIRVGYLDALDYELDSYLGRIQYAEWHGDIDSQRLLDELTNILSDLQTVPIPTIGLDQRGDDPIQQRAVTSRPSPACDPRPVRAPGGTTRIDDCFYIPRRPSRGRGSRARRRRDTGHQSAQADG
jgi:hypothetical protein